MNAVEYFNNGYSCSESMIKWAIDEGLVAENLLSVATPFSGGIGVGCICGAVAGAQMIIGDQYGRDKKYNNDVFARKLAKEFMNKFMETHKTCCCRVLTRGLDMASAERKSHCSNMVNDCQNILESLIRIEAIK